MKLKNLSFWSAASIAVLLFCSDVHASGLFDDKYDINGNQLSLQEVTEDTGLQEAILQGIINATDDTKVYCLKQYANTKGYFLNLTRYGQQGTDLVEDRTNWNSQVEDLATQAVRQYNPHNELTLVDFFEKVIFEDMKNNAKFEEFYILTGNVEDASRMSVEEKDLKTIMSIFTDSSNFTIKQRNFGAQFNGFIAQCSILSLNRNFDQTKKLQDLEFKGKSVGKYLQDGNGADNIDREFWEKIAKACKSNIWIFDFVNGDEPDEKNLIYFGNVHYYKTQQSQGDIMIRWHEGHYTELCIFDKDDHQLTLKEASNLANVLKESANVTKPANNIDRPKDKGKGPANNNDQATSSGSINGLNSNFTKSNSVIANQKKAEQDAKKTEEARKKAEEDAKKAEEEARKKAGKSTRDDTRRKVLSGFKR